MTWFKTTDTLMTDAKVMTMPLHERGMALGTWIACGTWSAQHLTDGKVPSGVIESFVGTLEGAETLVRAKMWKRVRGGYLFNNWSKYQFTREQVEDKREQERARKAEAREKARARRQVNTEDVPDMSHWDAAGTNAVSDIPVPSRPVPTRPDPSLPISSALGGKSPKQRASNANPQACGREHDPADPCGACGAARKSAASNEAEAQRVKAASDRAAIRAAQAKRRAEDEAARAEAEADPERVAEAKARALAAVKEAS